MQYTDVYNLKKPDLNDLPTIRDINENMEVIEEALPSYIKVLYGETVPTSRIPGKFYLISLDETNTNYRVEDSEGNIVHSETNDENVVHKTGDETINGVKSFGSMIKATNGTVQVGADTGYSVTFNYNGNITSKQARGTYNIFFPEGNGTLALTSDIAGKANDNNVVHKTGDETINGIKTFNDTVIQKQDGIFKNDNIDITITPSSNFFAHLFFADKNSVANAYMRYGQRTNGINELNLFVRDKDLNNYGVSVNTNNEFLPVLNNTYSLGSSGLKWAKVYSTNDITNNVITYSVTNHDNTSSMTVCGGSSWNTGSTLFLYGNSHFKYPGVFDLTAKNTTSESKLIGFPNGTLTWGGKNIALDENLVHRSGNEYIGGIKSFSSAIYLLDNIINKNNQVDLTVTPTTNLYSHYMFIDKNGKTTAYMQHSNQTSGTDFIGLFVKDKSENLIGVELTTNKAFIPFHNNTYSLGSSNNKWANVYATTFNGSLKGNVETSSLLVNSDTFKHVGSNNGVHYVHRLPKFDGELLGTTFVKVDNGWYRKHSDGFIEQFFYITSVKTFEEKTINFHIPFTTIHYNISVIGSRYASSEPNKTDDLIFTNGNSTPTYAKLYVYDGGDNNYYTDIQVYVCGY